MFLIKFQEYFEKMYSCSGALISYFCPVATIWIDIQILFHNFIIKLHSACIPKLGNESAE